MNWVIMPYIDNIAMTRTALEDLLNQRMLDLRVLAIDNGGREQGLPLTDSRVAYWRYRPALLSLATVWNTALNMVWAAGGQHALVVNNDVRVPRVTYERLLAVHLETEAWFVSACNVGEAYNHEQAVPLKDVLDSPRGGPDFSCFLITRECHQTYQFDEGFIPAYCEDLDYHRRLMLGGHRAQIFSVPVPYLHYGSGTLRSLPEEQAAKVNRQIDQCRAYYARKWGGPVNHERYRIPFDPTSETAGATTPELQHGQAV